MGYRKIIILALMVWSSVKAQNTITVVLPLDSNRLFVTADQVKLWNSNTYFQEGTNVKLSKANDSTILVSLFIPQLSSKDRDAMKQPPIGMIIYNKDSKRLNYRREDKWVSIWGDL